MHTKPKRHYWLSYLFSAQLDPLADIFSAENLAFSDSMNVQAIELTNRFRYRTWFSNWPAKLYFDKSNLHTVLDKVDQTKALVLKSQYTLPRWLKAEKETPPGFEHSEQLLAKWWGPKIGHMQDPRPNFATLLHSMLSKGQLDRIYHAGNRCPNEITDQHKYFPMPSRLSYLRNLFYRTPISYCTKLERTYYPARLTYAGVFSSFQMDDERANFLRRFTPPGHLKLIGNSAGYGFSSITGNKPVGGLKALELSNAYGWQLLHLNSSLSNWGGWITPRIAQCLKQNQLLLIPIEYRTAYSDLFSKAMLDANCVRDMEDVKAKIEAMQTWAGYADSLKAQREFVNESLIGRTYA